ncbi:MAG: hypothetical protein PVG71_01600, partial [Anaerolineae bacterium]
LECVGAGVWDGGDGSLAPEGVGLAVWVGEGVGERGVGDGWKAVRVGRRVGVLLEVGEEAVGDSRWAGRAVSVAETASAIAVAAALLGSAVLNVGEHAAPSSSKTWHAARRVQKVVCFTLLGSSIDVQNIPQHGRG